MPNPQVWREGEALSWSPPAPPWRFLLGVDTTDGLPTTERPCSRGQVLGVAMKTPASQMGGAGFNPSSGACFQLPTGVRPGRQQVLGRLDRAPAPAPARLWGVNQQVGALSVSTSLINK